MENIDDLMRQKFDSDDPGERFEFQEEYWEQAQALLEREEDRRRRWLWFFIGLAVAIALFTWFLLGQSGLWSQNKTGTGDSTTFTKKTEKQITSAGTPSAGEPETKAESGKAGGQISSDKKEPEVSISEAQASSVKTGQASLGTRGKVPDKNFSSGPKSQGSASKTRNNYKSRKSLPQKRGPENAIKTVNLSESTATTAESASQPLNTVPSQQNQTLQNLKGNPGEAEDLQAKNLTTSNLPILASLAKTTAGKPIINLPTPLIPFPIPARVVVPKKVSVPIKEPITNTPDPVTGKRFSFGLSVVGAAYQKPDQADKWAGWAIGAFGDYRLNKNWSLMVGAQWRFLPGYDAGEDSLNSVSAERLRYSFGYKSELWQRETRGLHYLEIPISVRWQKDRWGLESGVAVGKLLTVQNQTKYTVISSLEPAKTTTKKFVKGNTQPYNQVNFAAFAGVAYRLNNRLSLTSRVQYRFTPVFKPDIERVNNKGFGNVELGLRVRLF